MTIYLARKNIQRRFSFPEFETCRLPCGPFLHGRFPASYSFKEHKVLLYYGFKHHFLLIFPCGAVWIFSFKYIEHWCISKSMSSLQWNTKISQVWVLFLLAAMVNVYIYYIIKCSLELWVALLALWFLFSWMWQSSIMCVYIFLYYMCGFFLSSNLVSLISTRIHTLRVLS